VSGASVQPSNNTAPGTAIAVITTIAVGLQPWGVAINDSDDTIYVANNGSNYVSVINGRTGVVDGTITAGNGPNGVAVNQSDDTVYVSNDSDSTVSVINGRTGVEDDTITVGSSPYGVAVNQTDDTVYVNNYRDSTVSVINGRTGNVDRTINVAPNPEFLAVNQADDSVYVPGTGSDYVSVINGRTELEDDTITVGSGPYGVAVDQTDGTVYVANWNDSTVSVIDGRTGLVVDTITVGTSPAFLTVDEAGTNRGVVYVTNYSSNDVSVLAQVSPSITPSLSPAGSVVTVTLDVPQVGFDVDDSTITSVLFDGTPATGLSAGAGDTWTVEAPAGSGTVAVTVELNGGLTASAGTFTYGSPAPPAPPVVYPPSAPSAVNATAGDASAEVAWSAPSSAGSFPIGSYQAVVSPGGQSCLVAAPALSCTVSGLMNGTSYTATVRALNGAGWSAYSSASSEFTPTDPVTASIVITGTRGDVRGRSGILLSGTSQGLAPDTSLTAWMRFPGQSSYTAGSARIRVSPDGDFAWQRRTNKKMYVVVRSVDGTVKSNRLIVDAR
jgi:YVTN family beta-propeller protein